MAGKNSTRPKRSGSCKPIHPPAVVPTAKRIPPKTKEVIQEEIRRLQKALAVMTCLREAAVYEVEVDLADVAAVACDLVDKALYELDRAGLWSKADDPDAATR